MPKRHVAVISDKYIATAFRLIGVESYPVKTPREAAEALEKIARREDIGIVLVASEFYGDKAVQERIKLVLRERPEMLISKLPTPRSPGKPVDMRKKLLQALGIG
ncbi:MAG: V-type ATP synthase subunit F [Crenarchaeota archaeon]|nr:V-type ATP synthase subunit F [Thermoproteota archaeon]